MHCMQISHPFLKISITSDNISGVLHFLFNTLPTGRSNNIFTCSKGHIVIICKCIYAGLNCPSSSLDKLFFNHGDKTLNVHVSNCMSLLFHSPGHSFH